MRALSAILGLALVAGILTAYGCAPGSAGADGTKPQTAPTPPPSAATTERSSEIAVVNHPNVTVGARLLRSGQFLDAEIVLSAVLRESPNCARAQFLLGVAVMKQKRYAQARPLLEASLASKQPFPDAVQVDHFLGWTCYYLGDLDAAKRAFQSHVRNVPTAADSYFGLGVIAIDEDRIADARSALERSIELLPPAPQGNRDRSKALARLGDCAMARDETEAALAHYEEAASLWPDHYEIWGKLARVYEFANRPEDAARSRSEQEAAMKRVGRSPETESTP